jgi:hypothetical protein
MSSFMTSTSFFPITEPPIVKKKKDKKKYRKKKLLTSNASNTALSTTTTVTTTAKLKLPLKITSDIHCKKTAMKNAVRNLLNSSHSYQSYTLKNTLNDNTFDQIVGRVVRYNNNNNYRMNWVNQIGYAAINKVTYKRYDNFVVDDICYPPRPSGTINMSKIGQYFDFDFDIDIDIKLFTGYQGYPISYRTGLDNIMANHVQYGYFQGQEDSLILDYDKIKSLMYKKPSMNISPKKALQIHKQVFKPLLPNLINKVKERETRIADEFNFQKCHLSSVKSALKIINEQKTIERNIQKEYNTILNKIGTIKEDTKIKWYYVEIVNNNLFSFTYSYSTPQTQLMEMDIKDANAMEFSYNAYINNNRDSKYRKISYKFNGRNQLYEIDFADMTQKNTDTGYSRNIIRKSVIERQSIDTSNLRELLMSMLSNEIDAPFTRAEAAEHAKKGWIHRDLCKNKHNIIFDLVLQWFKLGDPDNMFNHIPKEIVKIRMLVNQKRDRIFQIANVDINNFQLLIHGTKPDNLLTIYKNGLSRAYNGGVSYFGKGIYFSKDVSYVLRNEYCKKDIDGYYKLLICKVAAGKEYEPSAGIMTFLMAAPDNCDSVKAKRDGCTMTVVYDDVQAVVLAEVWINL